MNKLTLISVVVVGLIIVGYILSMKMVNLNNITKQFDNSNSKNNISGNNSNLIICDNNNNRGRPLRVQKSSGESILTNGPTDPQLIKVINTGNTIRADARNTYLQNFNAKPIPIIAPANGTLIYIEYKTRADLGPSLGGADYDLEFAVDCKTIYRINHITNPSDAIRALSRLKEPAKLGPGIPPNEQDTIPTQEFMVKAGDQLGTTTGTPTAHNWDFAVYVDRQASCPYNLLPRTQRLMWLNLLSPTNNPIPGTPCNVSGSM